jgi:hypothetical protein
MESLSSFSATALCLMLGKSFSGPTGHGNERLLMVLSDVNRECHRAESASITLSPAGHETSRIFVFLAEMHVSHRILKVVHVEVYKTQAGR